MSFMNSNLIDEDNIIFEDSNFYNIYPLRSENIMDYFKLSGFYNKESINQQCEDKNLNFAEDRFKLKGIEYILEEPKDNDLFIIAKYFRENGTTTLLGYYYVFKGKIIKAPNLYSIISSNIQSVSDNFLNIFNYISDENEVDKKII